MKNDNFNATIYLISAIFMLMIALMIIVGILIYKGRI